MSGSRSLSRGDFGGTSTPRLITFARALRPAVLLVGILTLVWALVDARFRDSEGAFIGLVVMPLSGGLVLAVAGLAVATAWQRAAFWFALALFSQAATLQLIDAGWQLRYQHYKSIAAILNGSSPVIWGVLVLQIVLVGLGIAPRWRTIRSWTRANVRPWQVFVLGGVFFLSTTTVSEEVGFFIREWVFACVVQTLQLANVILIALSIPSEATRKLQQYVDRVLGAPDGNAVVQPGPPDRLTLTLAVWVVLLAASLNVLAYDRHPHVPDEVAYLTHASFFANGRLTMPKPPVPEAFEVYLMRVDGDRWYPAPPPGWPAILAVGTLVGVPWLVNPTLAGLNVLLAYILLRELYPRRTARLAVLLLGMSPWYIFLGMSFMTHMFSLTCALLAILGVARARRIGNAAWTWGGGLALGAISLIRPLEAVAVAGLLGSWAIGLGGTRLRVPALGRLIAGALITGALGLIYNQRLTGQPFVFPLNAYTDQFFGPNVNAYGFGPDRGMGWAFDPNPGHSPLDALINTNLNVSTLNAELFGWSIGSLLPIAILLAWGPLRRSDYLMIAAIVMIYCLHFFFYFSGGPDFGARYWFLMVVPLVAMAARGSEVLATRLTETCPRSDARLYGVVAVLCVMSVVNFVPWRATDKYHDFRGMRPDVRELARDYDFGRSLVLIRGNQHPDYDSAMVYNPVNLRANAPIYAWDRDAPTRKKLLAAYADRVVWVVNSPSVTGRAFEVTAGPLAAADLLEDVEK